MSPTIDEVARQVARRYAGTPSDRDLLMQAARIGAWQAEARFDAERARVLDARRRYITRGADIAARNELGRIRASREVLTDSGEVPEEVDPAPSPETTVAHAELLAVVRRGVGLTEHESAVLGARLDGVSRREIAEGMGVSTEWVRRLETRAVDLMRRRLEAL